MADIQVGTTIRHKIGDQTFVYHVRAIADDHLMVRFWHRRAWNYKVVSLADYEFHSALGTMTVEPNRHLTMED